MYLANYFQRAKKPRERVRPKTCLTRAGHTYHLAMLYLIFIISLLYVSFINIGEDLEKERDTRHVIFYNSKNA